MITEEEYRAACEAGEPEQDAYGAVAVRYEPNGDLIVIRLARGVMVAVPRTLLQGLETATAADLEGLRLSGSGLGLRIERLDWDMSIPGIMQGRYGSERWMRSIDSKMHVSGGSAAH